MKRLLLILFTVHCSLFTPAPIRAQDNRWFGMPDVDSTRWGWNLPYGKWDGFWIPGDTTGNFTMQFSFVATDTAELKEDGYYVIFNGFWLSTTEVTQGQWTLLMGAPLPHWTERGEDLPAVASR